MDPKRELTSVDIAAVATELSAYRGAALDKAYLYPDESLLRLKLRHYEHGRIEVLLQVGDPKRVHVTDVDRVPTAPERPPNFAMMMRNRMTGAELADVSQFAFDRVLTMRFERDDGSTTVVAELFGDGNIAVLDESDTVVDCLDTVRLKSRTVAPGSKYEFPSARFNPLTAERDRLAERIRQSDADVVRTLATQCNFGGLYGEELCTRADVPYNIAVEELSEEQLTDLHRVINDLGNRLADGDFDPRIYFEADEEDVDSDDGTRKPVDATPFPLEEYSHLPSDGVETFNEALDDYFNGLEAAERAESETTGSEAPDFQAEIEKFQRIIDQQEGAIEDFEEQAAAEREKAELVYARYDLVDEVLSTIQGARADSIPWDDIAERFEDGADQGIEAAEAVDSVDGSKGTVTLDLDGTRVTLEATTGVEKNADRLYQEAKRIEEKQAGAREAIAETREQLAAAKQRREDWDAGENGESATDGPTDEEEPADVDWLSRASIPIRQTEEWYERFRWFHTSDDFLVIGGRNAEDNEALVEKYLEPGDRFLHAQAHGGPVTVLKATGPSEAGHDVDIPERSVEEAARFAISYSSVWKNGVFAGDVYAVDPDQVSKTPESGEYLEKGGFAIRGDRDYYRDVPVGVAVGITCEDQTQVIGGPPAPITEQAATTIHLEPGQYAQNDTAKRCYREFKARFADDSFVRKIASPDLIQEFLPPGGSRIIEE